MKTLETQDLSIVAGGLSKGADISAQLTSITSSIKDVASQKNNSSNDLLLPMVMMMAFNRPQPNTTVVAAGAPAPAAPGGPIINISNRFRSRW